MPPTKNDASAAIAAIRALEKSLMGQRQDSFDTVAEKGVKYIGWIWIYSAALIACVGFVWNLRSEFEKSMAIANNTIDRNRVERQNSLEAMNLRISAMDGTVKDLGDKTKTMWDMMISGRSNKEEYMLRNHIAAPILPEK